MSARDTADTIVQQLRNLFPDSQFTREVERNVRAVVQSQLHKLDLVSREEFEAQAQVLQRSREKIDRLERQLAELMEQQEP